MCEGNQSEYLVKFFFSSAGGSGCERGKALAGPACPRWLVLSLKCVSANNKSCNYLFFCQPVIKANKFTTFALGAGSGRFLMGLSSGRLMHFGPGGGCLVQYNLRQLMQQWLS